MYFGQDVLCCRMQQVESLVLIRSRQEALIRQRKSGLRMVPLVRVQICQWLVAIE